MARVEEVEANAFKRLYPEQYFNRFLDAGVRPDGRTLGRARPLTVGPGAVTSADGSALVKVGSSSALAGVRMDIIRPDELVPDQGQMVINVDYAQFASADCRAGRTPEQLSHVSQVLSDVLLGQHVVQLRSLCIAEGKAAWRATLDVYVLDADGSVLDVALLAAAAALRNTRIPAVRGTKDGNFVRSHAGADDASNIANSPTGITLQRLPLCVTCCLHKTQVLVDPTSDEEALAAACTVSVVVDEDGSLLGLYKMGGQASADMATLAKCIEAAKLRHKEVSGILLSS